MTPNNVDGWFEMDVKLHLGLVSNWFDISDATGVLYLGISH